MGTYSDLMQSKPTTPLKSNLKGSDSAQLNKPENTPEEETKKQPSERFSVRKTEQSDPFLASFPYKRRTKRYSFEFYDDQILAIKRLVYEANLSGENISQSDIVRAALDEYLKEDQK